MEERIRKAKEVLLLLLSESFGQQYGMADFVEGNDEVTKAIDELAVESDLYQRLIKEIDIVLGIEDANLDKDMQEAYDKYDGGPENEMPI